MDIHSLGTHPYRFLSFYRNLIGQIFSNDSGTQEQGLELKSKTFPGKIAQSYLEPSTLVFMVVENGACYPICIFTHVPYIHVLA